MNGIINCYKPKGMTSHDVVSFLRRTLKTKKVGHTGTLDPEVAGVLPICIGRATKVAEYLLESDKEYIGEITLGFETDTQDFTGKVLKTSEYRPSEEEIKKVFSKYVGDIKQIPPMYSALKYKGRKLYEYAREGIEVPREARDIKISNLEILNIDEDKILFKVACSKGTYIRTLCTDIGNDLGSYGYMSYLIRTSTGAFHINDAFSLDYIKSLNEDELQDIFKPMDMGVDFFEEITLRDEDYDKIINGVMVEISKEVNADETYRIYCKDEFIGIGKILKKDSKQYVKMDKLLMI